MVVEDIKKIKSGKRELRQFGITMGVVLALLAGLLFWREKEYSRYFLTFSLMFFLIGWVLPVLLKPLHKLWMTVALLIGWCVTRLILIILFYLVVTPIGLLTRLCGKDFLDIKGKKNATSYWVPRKPTKWDKTHYENQF